MAGRLCYDTTPLAPDLSWRVPETLPIRGTNQTMARSCSICGKVSMGGFNPQSSGMNRVRAHRRYQPNLQVTTLPAKNGGTEKVLACTRCRRTLTKNAR